MSEQHGLNHGYSGQIVFYKSLKSGSIYIHHDPGQTWEEYIRGSSDDIFLGKCNVEVTFEDSREQEIEALEGVLKRADAAHEAERNTTLGRIQELKALEHIE